MRDTDDQLQLFPEAYAPGDEQTAEPGDLPGFSVRESARARRLSIKVYPRGRVEVVVPKRTRPRDVEAFVSENRRWIARALESFAGDIDPATYQLPSVIELAAIDRRFVVVYRYRAGQASVRYRELGDTLVLTGATDDEELCRKALRRWLTAVARREFEPRLHGLSLALALPFRRMQVRAQRTCWGSHSSSGTISINLCLLFVPAEVVRYLFVHELCHGRHMNHSAAFWRLVRVHEPGYRRLDRELGESWRKVPGWVGIY
ncbi:MAG: SprT family zinc-dependent metalloprotease [Pseudomonadota bacterium]